jgi:hypothetical protein
LHSLGEGTLLELLPTPFVFLASTSSRIEIAPSPPFLSSTSGARCLQSTYRYRIEAHTAQHLCLSLSSSAGAEHHCRPAHLCRSRAQLQTRPHQCACRPLHYALPPRDPLWAPMGLHATTTSALHAVRSTMEVESSVELTSRPVAAQPTALLVDAPTAVARQMVLPVATTTTAVRGAATSKTRARVSGSDTMDCASLHNRKHKWIVFPTMQVLPPLLHIISLVKTICRLPITGKCKLHYTSLDIGCAAYQSHPMFLLLCRYFQARRSSKWLHGSHVLTTCWFMFLFFKFETNSLNFHPSRIDGRETKN